MSQLYDKAGLPIDSIQWKLLCQHPTYFSTALTNVTSSDLSESLSVSTGWHGLDSNLSEAGPPLIFETKIINYVSSSGYDVDVDFNNHDFYRWYSTEDDARRGHHEIVANVAATIDDPIITDGGWTVTRKECRYALACYEKYLSNGNSPLEAYGDDFMPLLREAARRGGFEIRP